MCWLNLDIELDNCQVISLRVFHLSSLCFTCSSVSVSVKCFDIFACVWMMTGGKRKMMPRTLPGLSFLPDYVYVNVS